MVRTGGDTVITALCTLLDGLFSEKIGSLDLAWISCAGNMDLDADIVSTFSFELGNHS